MLSEVYRMCAYSFGEPPAKFDFEYRDKDNNYHLDRDLTPQEFFKKYVGWNTEDYVSVINAPTEDKPYNHMYTIEMLGNVVGGREVRHLNVDMDTIAKKESWILNFTTMTNCSMLISQCPKQNALTTAKA